MHINHHSFDCTADAVWKLNPSVRAKFDSREALRDYMIGMAYHELADHNGYCGTGGFLLTSYTRPDGKERGVIASVAGHLADDMPMALCEAEGG